MIQALRGGCRSLQVGCWGAGGGNLARDTSRSQVCVLWMYQIPADVAMTVRTTAAAGRKLLLLIHDAILSAAHRACVLTAAMTRECCATLIKSVFEEPPCMCWHSHQQHIQAIYIVTLLAYRCPGATVTLQAGHSRPDTVCCALQVPAPAARHHSVGARPPHGKMAPSQDHPHSTNCSNELVRRFSSSRATAEAHLKLHSMPRAWVRLMALQQVGEHHASQGTCWETRPAA